MAPSNPATPRYRGHRLVLTLFVLFLATPILTTLLYSLSSSWGASILPDALSFMWYQKLWQDARFLAVFLRTILLILGTLLLATLIIVPAVFIVATRFPQLNRLMNLLILLPFTIPPVVSSVGLLQIYAGGPLPIVGTPWILLGCYFIIVLPFIYRALSDSLNALNWQELMGAGYLLGANTWQILWHVLLPNLRQPLLASLFLAFSTLLGEFVLTNILVGTQFETLQIYLYNVRQVSGHYTSAIVMSYFLFTLALTWLALYLSRSRR